MRDVRRGYLQRNVQELQLSSPQGDTSLYHFDCSNVLARGMGDLEPGCRCNHLACLTGCNRGYKAHERKMLLLLTAGEKYRAV